MSTPGKRGRAAGMAAVGRMLPARSIRGGGISRIKIVVGAVLTVALMWLVAQHTLVAHLASRSPRIALLLNPSHPVALLALAESDLFELVAEHRDASDDKKPEDGAAEIEPDRPAVKSARPSRWRLGKNATLDKKQAEPQDERTPAERRAEVRSRIQRALAREPLNAKALRMLGQLTEVEGDAAAAAKYMYAAVRLSVRESQATRWVVLDRMKQKDYAAAVGYVDALMRTNPRYSRFGWAALAEIAADEAGIKHVAERIATDPPWRPWAISGITANVTDARTPLNVLLAMKDTPSPPESEDISPYLDFLVRRGFHELAYYTWMQFLPPRDLARLGLITNGNFDRRPSGGPFDWQIPRQTKAGAAVGDGYTIAIAERRAADGHRGLEIDLVGGRVDFQGPSQILMLPPGNYKITGEVNAELRAQRGFRWRLHCITPPPPATGAAGAGGAAGGLASDTAMKGLVKPVVINPRIGESPMAMGNTNGWVEFEFAAVVPQEDCRAQLLRLDLDARSTSERNVSGRIRYDTIAIARVEVEEWPMP